MKKLTMIAVLAAVAAMMTGCSSSGKMRDVELKGLYVNGYSEVLAIGTGRLTSIPGERSAMAAHYREDTAWLQPSVKTHELDLFLVGSNTVDNADKIVECICKTFADIAPDVAKTNAEVAKNGGTAPLDVVKAGGEVRKAVQSVEAAASANAQSATSAAATATVTPTTDGACTSGNCTDSTATK